MAITLHPSLATGSETIDTVMSFHDGLFSGAFYQEINSPFTLSIMSVHPEDSGLNAFSTFTADSQFNLPLRTGVTGRSKQSLHQHNYFEFTYVLKGTMYQRVEEKRYFYPTGSCCLMNRNTLHTEEFDTEFVCIFFSVSVDFIKRLNNYGNTMLFSQEQEKSNNLILRFLLDNITGNQKDSKDFFDFVPLITETEQKDMIHQIFEDMVYTMLTPEYGSTYKIQYLFLRLIDILCNPLYYNAVHVTPASRHDSLLFARINQLLEEYHGRISNQQLSKLLNYNGTYLGKIVKKYTGQNLFRYRLSFTMKEASELLLNTNLSITDISLKLQFSNRAHFYKLFEEYYGTTPNLYRKQQRIM